MNHKNGYRQPSTKKIKASFFINVTFTIIELVGGLLTNSVAILSDAAHDLGDSVSLGIAWWTQKLAQKSENKASLTDIDDIPLLELSSIISSCLPVLYLFYLKVYLA